MASLFKNDDSRQRSRHAATGVLAGSGQSPSVASISALGLQLLKHWYPEDPFSFLRCWATSVPGVSLAAHSPAQAPVQVAKH